MAVNKKYIFTMISPLITIGILITIADFLKHINGPWVWVAFVLSYWIILFISIAGLSGLNSFKTIFDKPTGKMFWNVFAVAISLGSIYFVFENIEYYRIFPFLIAGIGFSLINPIFEELYWRKILFDNVTNHWWIYAFYFNLIFALMHFLALGKISNPNSEFVIVPITFLAGFIWSLVYKNTRTLKYIILGHLIMDICGFSALYIR